MTCGEVIVFVWTLGPSTRNVAERHLVTDLRNQQKLIVPIEGKARETANRV